MPWTTGVRIWAFRSLVGAGGTAFGPATGIMRGSILQVAAPSISGRTTYRPARSKCAVGRYGSGLNSATGRLLPTGGSDYTRAWLTILGSSLQKHYRVN